MKHWLFLHRQALLATLKLLLSKPLSSLLNLLVIAIAVALPLALYSAVASLQSLAARLPTEPQASLFLKPGAAAAEVARIQNWLGKEKVVKSVRHISREAALLDLQKSSGMSELLAGLGENPLPDSFSLLLHEQDPAALDTLAAALRADPAIEHVQLDSEWARRLAQLIALGREASLILTALLGAALLLVTSNLIRLQIMTRRDEIEVSKLIGASNSFIRRPFLYFALMQGVLGGLLGVALVVMANNRLAQPVQTIAALYGEQFSLQGLDGGLIAMSLAVVGGLSVLGASLAVQRHLRALD